MHPIHPMVVHFPIALLLASTLFDALAFRWRTEQFRETSLSLLILGILAAGAAVLTGHFAEEAVERMELVGHGFFFFTNAETSRAAVVYRRDDGQVGLIDEAD